MYCRKIYSDCMVLLNLVCNRRVAYFNIKFTVFYWRQEKAHKTVSIRSYETSPSVFEYYIYPPTCSYLHIFQLKSPSPLKIKTKTAGTAPVLAVPSSACTGSHSAFASIIEVDVMSDLCARSRKMMCLYSCDAVQALAMANASEKVRASYQRKKALPPRSVSLLSMCINIFVSFLYLYCLSIKNRKTVWRL